MIDEKKLAELRKAHKKVLHTKPVPSTCGYCEAWDTIETLLEENQRSYAEGFCAARDKAKGIAETLLNEKQKCSPKNKDHDDRWCPTCESMEDAYAVIAQRIGEMEP